MLAIFDDVLGRSSISSSSVETQALPAADEAVVSLLEEHESQALSLMLVPILTGFGVASVKDDARKGDSHKLAFPAYAIDPVAMRLP